MYPKNKSTHFESPSTRLTIPKLVVFEGVSSEDRFVEGFYREARKDGIGGDRETIYARKGSKFKLQLVKSNLAIQPKPRDALYWSKDHYQEIVRYPTQRKSKNKDICSYKNEVKFSWPKITSEKQIHHDCPKRYKSILQFEFGKTQKVRQEIHIPSKRLVGVSF